ncbi:XRE family transcriptional regulator [Iodidimonas sp. SYSU 1G8]|uniref:helix-turn-helix domain-containing protein n=1 Tax=Iodidimonas sp. SYSU 1G8 TaxID=3133967 RepID=UPI0031FEC76F
MTIHFSLPEATSVSQDRPKTLWPNLATIIARNISRLRFRAKLSQEALAVKTGLDRWDIVRLEAGAADASIALLWRIAGGLGVPFAALIAAQAPRGAVVVRRDRSEALSSPDGYFTSRALVPFDQNSPVEFYEVRIVPGHVERAEAHAAGTTEALTVTKGVVEITVGREPPYRLESGDTINFQADLPHAYANTGYESAVFHLVVHYRA